MFFGICALMACGIVVGDFFFTKVLTDELPVNFSYLLMVIVSLLGIEWLSRKLLRLA